MSFPRIMLAIATPAILAVGCDNPLALPPATFANIIDTVTVFSLQGTGIDQPSGYNIVTRQVARTDRFTEPFDWAFDINEDIRAVIFTTGSLGLSPRSGIQIVDKTFEDIKTAPLEDYDQDSSVTVDVGTIFVVRSRSVSVGCPFFLGQLPRYGKFRVLAFDTTLRSIRLESLVNVNCGYRSLEPGLPTQ